MLSSAEIGGARSSYGSQLVVLERQRADMLAGRREKRITQRPRDDRNGVRRPPAPVGVVLARALADCGNEKHVTERDDRGVGRDEGGDDQLDKHGELPST